VAIQCVRKEPSFAPMYKSTKRGNLPIMGRYKQLEKIVRKTQEIFRMQPDFFADEIRLKSQYFALNGLLGLSLWPWSIGPKLSTNNRIFSAKSAEGTSVGWSRGGVCGRQSLDTRYWAAGSWVRSEHLLLSS
jgi:hypothetical protein